MENENIREILKVTSINELRDIGEIVQLPSFDESHPFVAKLRRPSLMAMAQHGKIPNSLLTSANKLFTKGPAGTANAEIADENMMKEMFQVINLLCEAAFVEPTYKELVENGIELTDDQYLFVFDYSQRGVKALEKFR